MNFSLFLKSSSGIDIAMSIKHHAKYIFGLIMAVFLLSACNTSKYLSADQYLLKGNSIKLKSKGNINRKQELKCTNSPLFTNKMRMVSSSLSQREWFYFVTQDPNDTTKFDRWQQRVIAEPPAIYDPKLTEATEESMKFYLQYKGPMFCNVRKKIYITYIEPAGSLPSIPLFSQ